MADRGAHGIIADGQRSHLAVLFCDICDYTPLNEEFDPEVIGALSRRMAALATEVVAKHGGTLCQVYGDGVLSVYGLPHPREDDARRAIETALDLHAAVAAESWERLGIPNHRIRMHSGVHAGLVFVQAGGLLHGSYKLTGDAVNTAARLSGAAGCDEIVVSSVALWGLEEFYRTEPIPNLVLKGRRSAVQARRVLTRSDVRTRFEASSRRGLTEFVDRVAETHQLALALQRAATDEAQVVVIAGSPGIGKTRLLQEFRGRASALGIAILQGSCDSYIDTAPLAPFIQIVRTVFGVEQSSAADAIAAITAYCTRPGAGQLAGHVPTFLGLLGLQPWPGGGDTLTSPTAPVARALSALFVTLRQQSQLVIVVDDWQWADDGSRDVLGLLRSDPDSHGLCFVVGTRTAEAAVGSLRPQAILRLQPFGSEESARMISLLRPQELPFELKSALHQRSGGNPLFLEELCRSIPAQVRLDASSLELTSVPNTVQGVIRARVAALPRPYAELLQTCSVIGMEFSQSTLRDLSNLPAIDGLLETLASEDLIHPTSAGDVFRFKHGLTREVIYESVGIHRRQRIHRAVAQALTQEASDSGIAEQPETLAYHHRYSGQYEEAVNYSEIAGDRALKASSLDRARMHYGAALSALDKLEPSAVVQSRWVKLSHKWALPWAYSPPRAQLNILQRSDEYAKALGDTRALGHNSHWFGWFYYVLGDYQDSIASYRQACELALSVGDQRLHAQAVSSLGQAYGAAGRYTEALGHLDRGIELKGALSHKRRSSSLALGFAHALSCRGAIHSDVGRFALADSDFEQAIAIVADTGHAMEASVLSLRCMALLRQARFEECIAIAERALHVAERVNSAYVFATTTTFAQYARVMVGVGDRDAAMGRLRQAVGWLEHNDLKLFSSLVYACTAEAMLLAGDLEQADSYAAQSLARADRHDVLGESMAHRVRARVWMARGGGVAPQVKDSVQAAFRAAERRGSTREAALTSLLEAELEAARGSGAEARALFDHAVDEFERIGMPWYAEHARRLRAAL